MGRLDPFARCAGNHAGLYAPDFAPSIDANYGVSSANLDFCNKQRFSDR
jgi:hypothetical protein